MLKAIFSEPRYYLYGVLAVVVVVALIYVLQMQTRVVSGP